MIKIDQHQEKMTSIKIKIEGPGDSFTNAPLVTSKSLWGGHENVCVLTNVFRGRVNNYFVYPKLPQESPFSCEGVHIPSFEGREKISSVKSLVWSFFRKDQIKEIDWTAAVWAFEPDPTTPKAWVEALSNRREFLQTGSREDFELMLEIFPTNKEGWLVPGYHPDRPKYLKKGTFEGRSPPDPFAAVMSGDLPPHLARFWGLTPQNFERMRGVRDKVIGHLLRPRRAHAPTF